MPGTILHSSLRELLQFSCPLMMTAVPCLHLIEKGTEAQWMSEYCFQYVGAAHSKAWEVDWSWEVSEDSSRAKKDAERFSG